jgi:hypothetical protein
VFTVADFISNRQDVGETHEALAALERLQETCFRQAVILLVTENQSCDRLQNDMTK